MTFRRITEMQTKITKTAPGEPELLEIHCHTISDEVREIIAFVRSRQGQLTGSADDRQYEIAISDICYIESVDDRTFFYTKSKVYESRQRIYELEEMLREKHFLRVSKSTLLNLMKVRAIRPALNSRFTAELFSGDQVVISRKYVPDLKKALKGDKTK